MSELWARISARESPRLEIAIPEWGEGGDPFLAYARVATVADEVRVRRHVQDPTSPLTWARLVYDKLVDVNGARLFAGVGFADFQHQVPAWLSMRIGQQIYTGTVVSVEDAEKN